MIFPVLNGESSTFTTEGEYRALAGLPSYGLIKGIQIDWKSIEVSNPDYLCLTVSRDVREDNTIFLWAGKECLLEYPADYVSAGQRLRISLSESVLEKIETGESLRLTSSARLWVVAENDRYPRLGIGFTDGNEVNDSLGRLKDSAITQFGWMHGCVLDGLYELYAQTGDKSYLEALKKQLRAYLTAEAVNYESPRNKIAINEFESIELTLPIAVIAKLYPEHPSIDAALEYLESRTSESGLITDGWSTTAEGCYTIAYPLMLIGKQRNDGALMRSALKQLQFRREALWVEESLYLRRSPKGSHSFQHWARGICWYFLGTVRTLIASGQEPTKEQMTHLQELARYVAMWQDESGLWRNFITDAGQLFDTSGSSGIAAALALAANRGWIDAAYLQNAKTCHVAMDDYFVDGGFLNSVAPNNKRGEKEQRANNRTCEPFALGLYGQLHAALLESQ